MRILVVSAWAPRLDNGDGLILHHHLRELSSRHEIHVVIAQPARPDDSVIDGVSMIRFPAATHAAVDFAGRSLRSALHREPAHAYWVGRPALLSTMQREIERLRPDVVHLFGWGTAQLSGLTDRPTTYFAIDPWSRAFGNRILSPLRRLTDVGQRAAIVRHERVHLPRVDVVCLVNSSEVDALRVEIPGARFEAVPLGVELSERVASTSEPVIAFHGALDVQANRVAAVDLVRQVLPRVRRAVPDARVVLVGRDPVPEVQALSGEHVDVLGSVPSMPAALLRAAVEVAPMSVGTGMKNKVLEAMAVGLPVVTTSSGIAGIGAGAGVLIAEDYDGLAEHTIRLLLDPALRAETGAAGRERVRREFSWQASARRLEEIWAELAV